MSRIGNEVIKPESNYKNLTIGYDTHRIISKKEHLTVDPVYLSNTELHVYKIILTWNIRTWDLNAVKFSRTLENSK